MDGDKPPPWPARRASIVALPRTPLAVSMTQTPLVWIGLAGAAPDDNERTHRWQARLHRGMVAIALLSIPAYLLDTAAGRPALHVVASLLDATILAAFAFEMVWMIHLSDHPVRYALE